MEYYKKVDKSMFRYGVTLPQKIVKEFTYGKIPKPGTSRPVSLRWKNRRKKYDVSLLHQKRTGAKSVCHLRWDNHDELKLVLKKEFKFSQRNFPRIFKISDSKFTSKLDTDDHCIFL